MRAWGRRLGAAALGVGAVGDAARRLAAARGHGLVLVHHRLRDGPAPAHEVAPSVPMRLFRRQVEALAEAGRVVSPEELLSDRRAPGRARFVLTFDDDYPSHAERALPALRAIGVTGTFFLSGRSLHGRGPYWWELLEELVRTRGPRAAAASLGMAGADVGQLALVCERDLLRQRDLEREVTAAPRHLAAADIAALTAAGMTVGFHTLEHRVLPGLSDDALDQALVLGRRELQDTAGAPMRLFAYPHGKADRRTASRVRDAGYAAAFTGRPGPVRPHEPLHLLPRWEPGPLAVDDLLVRAAVRLHRPATTG